MDSNLFDDLDNFDFSTGEAFGFSCEYDLTNPDYVTKMDNDSADALSMVQKHGLSYDISARHTSHCVGGERETDLVVVEWSFWRNNSDG